MILRLLLCNNLIADPSLKWGGLHITIVGSNLNQDINKIKKTIFFNTGKKWRFSNSTKFNLKKWNGVWTIIFKSKTLDIFANELHNLQFNNIKGPKYSKTKWHISLPNYNKEQAYKLLNHYIYYKPYWYLTLSVENNNKFRWIRL